MSQTSERTGLIVPGLTCSFAVLANKKAFHPEGLEYCVHAKHIINLPGVPRVSLCVLYVFLPSFRVQK